MASENIDIILSLRDQASQSLQRFEGKLKGVGGSIGAVASQAQGLGIAMTAIGTTIAATLGASVKQAAKFESSMANVSTLISGDSTNAVNELSKGVTNLMKTVPQTADDLGASAYAIVSAGIVDTSDALVVLEASSKLATAGLGTSAEATDILTSAINAFGYNATDAAEVSNILFETVKAGKTTVAELATSFGASAPVIAAAGIELYDFQAATAALTTTGLPASQAQMGLRQAIVALQKPTSEMADLFDKLGVESGQALIEQGGNLADIFGQLRDATGGNNEEFAKALGSVEALNAVIGVLDTSSEAYHSTLLQMTDGINEVEDAFAKQMETFDNNWAVLRNNITVIAIQIGNVLLPILSSMLAAVTPIIAKVSEWAEKHQGLVTAIVTFVAALGGVLLVIGPILIALPTLIAMFTALTTVAGFLGVTVGTLVGLIIAIPLAIAAVVTGIILLIKNWDTVKEKTVQVWETIKNAVSNAVSGILSVVQSVFDAIVGFIKGILDTLFTIFKYSLAIYLGIWVSVFNMMGIDIVAIFEKIVAFLMVVFEEMKILFQVSLEAIKSVWNAVWQFHVTIFQAIWGVIKSVATAGFNILKGVFSAGAGVIASVWESTWGRVKGIVSSAWDGIKSMVTSGVNWVISKLNFFIAQYRKIAGAANVIPGVSLPSIADIPYLANGGIVTKPTLAMIGEGGESEAVVPLSKARSMGFGGAGATIVINNPYVLRAEDIVEQIGDPIIQVLKQHGAVV